MQYVYILQSQEDNGYYYIGTTRNLKDRLNNHNWHTVKSTKTMAPYKVIWYCAFSDKKKSLNFEKYLKTGSGIAFYKKRLIK